MTVLRALIIICGFLIPAFSFAQRDSALVLTDSIKPVTKPAAAKVNTAPKSAERIRLEKMPQRAAVRSAIIPGWGQLTNKRWWKVPLIYGGFVGIALVYDFNQTNYKIFLTEAQNRTFNLSKPPNPRPLNPAFTTLSQTGIITIKDGYRRNRDLTVLGGIAFYTINIIDAYIDAKFFRFDISDDLALQLKPAIHQQPVNNGFTSPLPGFKVSLSFSK